MVHCALNIETHQDTQWIEDMCKKKNNYREKTSAIEINWYLTCGAIVHGTIWSSPNILTHTFTLVWQPFFNIRMLSNRFRFKLVLTATVQHMNFKLTAMCGIILFSLFLISCHACSLQFSITSASFYLFHFHVFTSYFYKMCVCVCVISLILTMPVSGVKYSVQWTLILYIYVCLFVEFMFYSPLLLFLFYFAWFILCLFHFSHSFIPSIKLWRFSVGLLFAGSIFHATCRISAYSHLHKYMYLCTKIHFGVICFTRLSVRILHVCFHWSLSCNVERLDVCVCVRLNVLGRLLSFSLPLYRIASYSVCTMCHKPKSNSIACLIILFIL